MPTRALCNDPSPVIDRHGGGIIQIIKELLNRPAEDRMTEFRRDLGERRERESPQAQTRVRQRQRDAVTNAVYRQAVKEEQVNVYRTRAFRDQSLAAQTGLDIETKFEQRKRLDPWRGDGDGHVQKIGLVELINRLGLVN